MSTQIATCIGCGCDDDHACISDGHPDSACHWVRVDRAAGVGVCSACPISVALRWDAGDRSLKSKNLDLDWPKAKKHFDYVRAQYQDLEGMPGVNTSFALHFVFSPLARRYNAGERTKELHDEMMAVE